MLCRPASSCPSRWRARRLGKAGQRTIFLRDYFSKPAFRRGLHAMLIRGESAHALQRAVYHGLIFRRVASVMRLRCVSSPTPTALRNPTTP